MKRFLILLLIVCAASSLSAQDDPVLMRINGREITRSEFEYLFNKNRSQASATDSQDLDQYVELFINYKLKVYEAESQGIDTTQAFREELAGYRDELAKSYFSNLIGNDAILQQLYNHYYAKGKTERVLIRQIFKYLPQNASALQQQRLEYSMDSVYRAMESVNFSNFAQVVERYSDLKQERWIGWLEEPEEFESRVFAMRKNQISRPFYTPAGIHIVYIVDRKEAPTFSEAKPELVKRLGRKTGEVQGRNILLQNLKNEYHYTPNQPVINALYEGRAQPEDLLFTLNGYAYTVRHFLYFAGSNHNGVRKQFDEFVMKTVFDYENTRLEDKYPAFKYLMQEYREGMLLFEISNREVWEKATDDRAGQEAFFVSHHKKYKWNDAHFHGLVLHCRNKKMMKRAKKMVKKLPIEEQRQVLQKSFNSKGVEQIKIEEGVFAEGDNIYVDKLVFKKGNFEPVQSYPYTTVIGKKIKTPDDYQEVLLPLTADYQVFLETRWVKRLREKSKVEINQEVLKTVNNHSGK